MKKALATISIALGVTGCAFHHKPYVAHDPGTPLHQTAVFSVVTETAATAGALEIIAIDGKELSCAQAGCPVWARVAPGKHTFALRFRGDYSIQGGTINWKTATLSVDVADMRSRHVYHALHERTASGVQVKVRDLGERPHHGVSIGLEGANRKFHAVEF
jgi:hypothetical protein